MANKKKDKVEELGLFSINPVINQFYLNSNNNLIRNYLSLDSINCLSSMTNKDVLGSIGSYFNDALVISHMYLKNEVIENDILKEENAYPVCLGLNFNFNESSKIPVVLVTRDYSFSISTLSEYNPDFCLLAIIMGTIPFSYVNKVVFSSTEERETFDYVFSNIHNPREIYAVESSIFSNSVSVDLNVLSEKYYKFIKVNEIDLIEIADAIKLRDRIKGIMLGVLRGYKRNIDKYTTYVDGNVLDFIEEDRYARENYVATLVERLNIRSIDTQDLLANTIINNEDNTPFRELISVLPHFSDDLERIIKFIDNMKLDESERADLITFTVIVRFLLLTNTETTSIKDLIILIVNSLEKFTKNDQALKIISAGLNFIQTNILTDFENINDLLTRETGKPKNKSIRAFIVFSKAPYSGDFVKLSTSLANFPISVFEKRLVWIFFGAWHGVSAFNKEFKESPHVNRIADQFTVDFVKSKLLINSVPKFTEFIKYRKVPEAQCMTEKGYLLDIQIQLTREEKEMQRLHYQLLEIFRNETKDRLKIISSVLLKSLKKYIGDLDIVIIIEKTDNTTISQTAKRIEVRKAKKGYRTEIDLESLFTNAIQDEECFQLSFKNNKMIWLEIDKKLKEVF